MILCVVGCTRHEKKEQARPALRVQTTVVTQKTDGGTARYVGTIVPSREIPLTLQSTGRIVAIRVKNGQRVRKGQEVLAVDNTQALNALQGAKATLKHAQDGYDRVRKVHAKGVVSDQKMVEIESQLAQARSLFATAQQRLNECSVKAPCDGVISGLNLEIGQSLLPGERVCTLLDVAGFNVRFTVPENEIGPIAIGEEGEVECSAVEKTLPIVVTEKSLTANPLAHTYEVVARIEGETSGLMSNMVGKVMMKGERVMAKGEGIVIPANCILLKPEGPTVWVVEQGRAVRRDITIDGYRADGVRVLSGLAIGDSLITSGYQKLYKDCRVVEDK